MHILHVWLSGVVVITLALINEVNLRRTRLVLRWVTVSGSIPGDGHLFQYVTNQPPKANSAFHPYGVGKWVPASAGKAKAGVVHSVSGRTRGVQVKLWDPLRTRAIPERLRGAFTTRRYTNPRLPFTFTFINCSYYTLLCCTFASILSFALLVIASRFVHFLSLSRDLCLQTPLSELNNLIRFINSFNLYIQCTVFCINSKLTDVIKKQKYANNDGRTLTRLMPILGNIIALPVLN